MTDTQTTHEAEAKEGTVVPRHAAMANVAPKTADELMAHIVAEGSADGDAPQTAHDAIIAQVLNAQTPEAVLTPVEAMNGQDVIGVRLLLGGWNLNKSEYDVGSPFYASMQVMAETEAGEFEPAVVNSGHKKVLAQLVKLQEFDQYPYRVMFRTRGTSAVGTPMLELVQWDEPPAEPPPF